MAKLPIADFLTARLQEYNPKFDVRKGTGFSQLFITPMQFMTQPIADEITRLEIAQSFLRILQQSDPDAFDEEPVDALAANLFVTRAQGSTAAGVARVYYSLPVTREWPEQGAKFTGSNGLVYFNPAPFIISEGEMSANTENGAFYYDIPVVSQDSGADVDLEADSLISLDTDSEAIAVTNKEALSGGAPRETNSELIARVQSSIAVRDLVTGKGFSATLFENFLSFLTEVTPIGFGDPEMMRDIQYNTHIGGKIDGYFKAATVKQGFKNFVGLLEDDTRQTYSSTNIQLYGTDYTEAGEGNFDESNGKSILVQQVKAAKIARYLSTVDLSGTVSLAGDATIKIGVTGSGIDIIIAGSIPSTTTKSEIINRINQAFGYTVAYSVGSSIELRTPTKGLTSYISISNPDSGTSALSSVFGLSAPGVFFGDGPITFIVNTHYTVNAFYGSIARVIGATIVSDGGDPMTTGELIDIGYGQYFVDPTPDVFEDVAANDVVTIHPNNTSLYSLEDPDPSYRRDFRVLSVIDNNTLLLDDTAAAETDVSYVIRRTGIKDGEMVYVQYYFNPLSIDIGPLVKLDTYGATRGIRPGRLDYTITDVAFLRINSIEIIDPITFEPTGEVLATGGGYGEGGYGEGGYGAGNGGDYFMVVNSPTERFSSFEDSLIVLSPAFAGLSVRVNYDYVPECLTLHNFVRSSSERVVDGDILMKHYLPAYVSGSINYKVDTTDSTIPDNDTLTTMVKDFISTQKAGSTLDVSDVYQFIARSTDPYDRYGTYIKPFELKAEIHNADGTTTVISSGDNLIVPEEDPFPKETTHPLSPRITHWIGDAITMVREV